MFKLSEIASALQGRLVGPDCDNIGSITTDSRQARPGQIFFALKGKNFDGHNFALEAYRKTNAPVIVEREIKDISQQIIVADTQKALGQLANYYRKKFSPLVIAITGTNGKTTTKNIVGQILSIKDKTLITSGTMNNQIGLPLTLLRLTPEIRYCVLEMGTNSPGEIEQLCRIAQPDVGVLTNIGYGHIGGFKTRNDLIKEKLSLIENLPPHSIAVVNARISYIYTNHRIVTFSLYRNAHYHPTRVILNETGSIFYIGKDRYQTHLLGRVNVENIIGSIALTTELGVKKEIQKT
ncbi:MAG: UDP-N-acetylmuramoyl-tripeptide--D-alanyl-D-alanine ligase, partial [candidate division WOR-3 bacterium]